MIKTVKLSDFRNFKSKTLEFSDGITVIVGPNTSGKTNILESLFLLSSGKSFKARIEAEMINYSTDIARVRGRVTRTVHNTKEKMLLEILLIKILA